MNAAPRPMTGSGGEARLALMLNALAPLDRVRPVTAGRYLVKGWLDRGAFSCLFGPSNVGKSFFALDLALHVSAGVDWFGHRVACAGPAVYVCAEGAAVFGNRVAALRAAKPEVVEKAAKAGMAILPMPVDLCGSVDADLIVRMIADALDARPSLVVIDTLARSLGSGNENDGKDIAALVASCGRIQAATGAHVMLIHHSGKDASRGLRGHSSLHAALDSEIELTSSGDEVKATTTKQRDLAFHAPIAFTLRAVEIGKDEDGDAVTSAIVEQITPAPRAKGALAANDAKRAEAEGRAIAALSLLPSGPFSAADAGKILAEAGAINCKDARSGRERARQMLLLLAELGRVSKDESGLFQIIEGGGNADV